MRFATLTFLLTVFTVMALPLSGQVRDETDRDGTDGKISARERWDALSIEKRHELVRIHKALNAVPELQRRQLIKRLRELPSEDSKKLIQRLHKFMNSSAEHRRDVRRRRTAFQLWDFQMEPEDRKRFQALAPKERRSYLDQQISERMDQIVSSLPEPERNRLEKLPEGDRRKMLLRRKLHQSLSLSRSGHRVMYLARHLNRDQMNRFIETGRIEEDTQQGGPHRLIEAIDQLAPGELDQIRKLLLRGKKARMKRRQNQGGHDQGPRRPPPPGGRANGDVEPDSKPRLRPQGSPRPPRAHPGSRGQLDRRRDKRGAPGPPPLDGAPGPLLESGKLDSGKLLDTLDHLA